MDEVVTDTGLSERVGQNRLDNILNGIIVTLVVAILAFAAFFGLSVWLTNRADYQARPTARAVENLKERVRANPNDPGLRVALGLALGTDGQYDEAVEQFNNALKLNEDFVTAYRGLGLVAYLQNDYEAASAYLLKVVELTEGSEFRDVNNTREEALFTLGVMSIDKKEYEDAVGYLKGALRIRRADSDTYYQLARAYRGLGEIDAAIEQLEYALAFVPAFAEAHFLMGELYTEKGDEINAAIFYTQAAQQAPGADPPQERLQQFGTPEERIHAAREALDQGDLEKALKEILVARALDYENPEAAKLHGAILVVRKDFKDALDVYNEALELAPNDQEIKDAIESLKSRAKKK
ncbi:MAG: tetratricopeptide repeat protein [Coriobacteriia bacterium]|nr:tetratricopeptide repeat protein [Coriobacteriia bacterium]